MYRMLLHREYLIHDVIPFVVQYVNKEIHIRTLNEATTAVNYINSVNYFEKEQTVYYNTVNSALL